MTDIVRASQGELTAEEILDVVDDVGRVLIEAPILGKTIENVVREQNGIYYCDAPTKLLTHESGAELRACLIVTAVSNCRPCRFLGWKVRYEP